MRHVEVIGARSAPILYNAIRLFGGIPELESWVPVSADSCSPDAPYVYDRAVVLALGKAEYQLASGGSGKRHILGFHSRAVLSGVEIPNPTDRQSLRESYETAFGRVFEYRVGIAYIRTASDGTSGIRAVRYRAQSLSVVHRPGDFDRWVERIPESEIRDAGLGYRPLSNRYVSPFIEDSGKEREVFSLLVESAIRELFPT